MDATATTVSVLKQTATAETQQSPHSSPPQSPFEKLSSASSPHRFSLNLATVRGPAVTIVSPAHATQRKVNMESKQVSMASSRVYLFSVDISEETL